MPVTAIDLSATSWLLQGLPASRGCLLLPGMSVTGAMGPMAWQGLCRITVLMEHGVNPANQLAGTIYLAGGVRGRMCENKTDVSSLMMSRCPDGSVSRMCCRMHIMHLRTQWAVRSAFKIDSRHFISFAHSHG